jgi:CheY-like chemotaxis protein
MFFDEVVRVRRVVVIDDDVLVGELTAALLSSRGCDVHVAASGQAGIQLVREIIPDAVLCDMRMPGIGGEEVLLTLKAQPATSHIPIVLMSGQCDAEFISMGDAFIWKPFQCDELVATIERLIECVT